MKTSIIRSLVIAGFLALMVVVNTGCPHSAQKSTTTNDSTAGNPPK
jgi:hypothetical protein